MRALKRPAAPACFAADTEERAEVHRQRYAGLRYPSGGIRTLWNDLDKDADGVGAVRRALLALTEKECAYCGLFTGNDHMQVDHYLSKEEFPFIAFAWENLLPSCDACNRRKQSFVPRSLKAKRIVDPCLKEHQEHDLVLDKEEILGRIACDDRLIDPSFDDPSEHIEIVMDFPSYRATSPIGKITYARLLNHREIADRRGTALCGHRDGDVGGRVSTCRRQRRRPIDA